jgi:hypothetical protein
MNLLERLLVLKKGEMRRRILMRRGLMGMSHNALDLKGDRW